MAIIPDDYTTEHRLSHWSCIEGKGNDTNRWNELEMNFVGTNAILNVFTTVFVTGSSSYGSQVVVDKCRHGFRVPRQTTTH